MSNVAQDIKDRIDVMTAKFQTYIDALATKYAKPSTGIPKTDLATDIQTSLGKADSAIQDISGKQNVTDNSLSTTDKTVVGAINEVNSIAKGANQALIADDYNELIFELNSATKDELNEGQNFYIRTVNVPDLWVYKIENSSIPYVYSGDAQVITDLEENGYIQVGFYKLAVLETQEINLTNYALKSWVEGKGYALSSAIPTKTSDLTNDSGFLTINTLPIYNPTPINGGAE